MKLQSEQSTNRRILAIALPAIVSNITVPLLSLCDTAVTGHLGSELYLAAIAVGTTMIQVVMWIFGFLRMGTTGITAQAYGAKESDRSFLVFTRALILALGIGLLTIIFQSPLLNLMLRLTAPPDEVRPLASLYFRVCVWSAPGLLGSMVVCGWFLGMQDARRPMIITIAANALNVVLSLLFVFGFRLGFVGVPLGTLAANWFSLGLALMLVRRFNGGRLPLAAWRKAFSLKGLGRFFSVNSDIFFRSLCIMAVTLSFTAFGARLGERTLAVNALLLQFFFIFSYFMDGFAYAAEALSGDAVGARNAAKIRNTVRALLRWTFSLAALFSLVYFFGFEAFARLITSQTEVVDEAISFRPWIAALPWVACAAFLFDGLYIGITATRSMMTVTFLSMSVFFLSEMFMPAGFGSLSLTGNNLLWFSFLAYLLCRGLILGLYWLWARPYEARIAR